MFEKTIDIFLQQSIPQTKPLPLSHFPESFRNLRRDKLNEIVKDESSFRCFKEKMIEMEKSLIKTSEGLLQTKKLMLPLIGFAKVYTNFCLFDCELVRERLNSFPNTIFTLIFKFLHEKLSKENEYEDDEEGNEGTDEFVSSKEKSSLSKEMNIEDKNKKASKRRSSKQREESSEERKEETEQRSQEKSDSRRNLNIENNDGAAQTFSEMFSEEMGELLFEINEAVEQNSLIVGTSSLSKLFHHVLNLIFHENLRNLSSFQQSFYKYLANMCIFFYQMTPDENDAKLILEEVFIRMQQPIKSMNLLSIELEGQKRINVLSYFFLKLPQNMIINIGQKVHYNKKNQVESSSFEELNQGFVSIVKLIRHIVGFLFRKCKEDLRNKTNLQRFIRIFLTDIMETLESQEILTPYIYHQSFASLIIDCLHHKSETDSMFKSFLLDFIKSFLLYFISIEQYLDSKKAKLSSLFSEATDQESNPSTSTKIRNRGKTKRPKKAAEDEKAENEDAKKKTAENSCGSCGDDIFDEDFLILSLQNTDKKSAKKAICLSCYLQKLIQTLKLPDKPEFSVDKLIRTSLNPLTLYTLLQVSNDNYLKSFRFYSARQFLLCDWLYQCIGKLSIKKSFTSHVENLISANFSPESALTFSKSTAYVPNKFIIKYLNLSLIFSEDCAKLSSAFKSSLLLLSNESTTIRNRVLETLQSIISKSPEMMFNPKFQEIITQRVLDSTASVRSSALAIIMRFYENTMIEEDFYFDILLERLNDIDSAIRKRIVFFFFENAKALKKNENLLEKVLVAAIYKIYDNEEISNLALNLVCTLLFEGFSEKNKKAHKQRKKSEKEALENVETSIIQRNIKICRNLCAQLKNNDWLTKVIKHSALNQDKIQTSQEEIKEFITLLINELCKTTETQTVQINTVNLEILLAFAKYYTNFLWQELRFLADFLKYVYEIPISKEGSTNLNEKLFIRKQAILILLEILDTLLIAQDEKEAKSKKNIECFKKIEPLLIKLIQEEALEILHKALKLLITSIKKVTENFFLIKNIYVQTYAFILKKKVTFDLNSKDSLTADNIQHFMRSLYILTFVTRYFDISEFFDEEEQLKPEFQEENLIKIIYNELIFFCRLKHPIIEQTCIECLMILWEKLPVLIFETRGFIEKYLADVSKENSENIEKIYVCFLNILLRHEEKIRRQNSLNRHLKSKMMEQQQKRKRAKNLQELEESDSDAEGAAILQKSSSLDEGDYEKLAVMIREMTKGSFSLHLFRSDVKLRKQILQLLQALIMHGHISSYEIVEYFICFLTDSNQEIREVCVEALKVEWKNSRFNVIGALNKGIMKAYDYLVKKGGKAFPFMVDEENKVRSFYEGLSKIMAKNSEEINNHFQVLVVENYDLYSNASHRDYLQFVCTLLLTIQEYNIWEFYEVLLRLFSMISKNFYKSIKKMKSSALKKHEKHGKQSYKSKDQINVHKDEADDKKKILEEDTLQKEDLNNCFNLLIQLLTFHLFIINCKGLKEIFNYTQCTPQECINKLERYVKKNPYQRQKETVDEADALKKKNSILLEEISYETVSKFDDFITKNLDAETFFSNQENTYIVYKKIKFLFSYNVSDDLENLFSLSHETLELYRNETMLWSKKKSKIKRAKGEGAGDSSKPASKVKRNKKVLIDDEKTKIFIEKKPKRRKKEAEVEITDFNYNYEGRLRKRANMKNFKEEVDDQ